MTFLIVSHVQHKRNARGVIGGYGPYVREMNIWLKYVDKAIVVAPIINCEHDAIDLPYEHDNIEFVQVPAFEFTSLLQSLRSIVMLPIIMHRIIFSMRRADHIHLRCPGNMGLLGCIAQIFFPKKRKTAKYAGNWDWKSDQPRTYRWQQYLLQNTRLTKNMTALVYGNWPGATANIKPFFTASYSEKEIIPTEPRSLDGTLRLVFIGGLNAGKRPLVSVQTAEQLHKRGHEVELDILGEGKDRAMLEQYIEQHSLKGFVHLRGNVNGEEVKRYVRTSHFLVFASMSEGWPKAVAESMFWGCVPLTTRVSCVAEMLADGNRGTLVNPDAGEIADVVEHYFAEPNVYVLHAQAAMDWSRQYTLEKFETEIAKLI
jgi:glycosyltransferase involved in cell wall biosynthesis